MSSAVPHTFGTATISRAKKVAGCWATYRGLSTCPSYCPLKSCCYAGQGNTAIHARRAEDETLDLVAYLQGLPPFALVRHLVTGDLDDQYVKAMRTAHRLRPDIFGIIYTHRWREYTPHQLSGGLRTLGCNASCETENDVRTARARGWLPVRVVARHTPPAVGELNCRNETHGMLCVDCRLCLTRPTHLTVRFQAHGNAVRSLEQVLERRIECGDARRMKIMTASTPT